MSYEQFIMQANVDEHRREAARLHLQREARRARTAAGSAESRPRNRRSYNPFAAIGRLVQWTFRVRPTTGASSR